MSGNDEQLQIVVRAVDEATQTMKAVQGLVTQLGGTAEETATKTGKMSSAFSAFGSVLQGMAIGAGIAIFNELTNVIGRIVDAIPQAVEAGYAWALQIHDIQVETGMTAEQTSSLAAVMRELGVPVDNANRLFAMFGKNLDTNEKLFVSLGIATRTANGDYLDTYTIIHELQQAFSAHGDSLTKTAAAQELFSRTGFTMLDFLNLTDAQMRQLTIDAGNAGMILGDNATSGAHAFSVAMGELQNDITGIQTSIFTALAPMLTSFVDSFGAFIQANMNNIVAFVVTVANFIGGVIGELFGIDLGAGTEPASVGRDARGAAPVSGGGGGAMKTPAASSGGGAMKTPAASSGGGGGAKGPDPYVAAIKEQTDAIDKQIAALTKLGNVQQAAKQQADLEKAITDAKAQLADLQNSAVNTYGLSAAEQIKAHQKRAADILAAQDKIVTTEVSLADWKRQQTIDAQKAALEDEKKALADQLAAHQAHNASVAAAYQAHNAAVTSGLGAITPIIASTFKGLDSTLTAGLKDFSQQAKDALAAGKAAAEGLKKTLGDVWNFITGSLIPGLQALWGWFSSLWGMFVSLVGPIANVVGWLNDFLAPIGGLAGSFERALNPLPDLLTYLGNVGDAFDTLRRDPMQALLTALGNIGDAFWNAGNQLPDLHKWLGKIGDAFSGLLKGVKDFVDGLPKIPSISIPGFAAGGTVEPRPGGTLVNVGEGGEREYVIPESKMPRFGALASARLSGSSGDGHGHDIYLDGQLVGRALEQHITEQQSRNMPAINRLALGRS